MFFLPHLPRDIHSLHISGKYILYMKAFSTPDQVKMTFEGKGQKLRGNKQTNKREIECTWKVNQRRDLEKCLELENVGTATCSRESEGLGQPTYFVPVYLEQCMTH